jgi:hypothetical protein
MTQDTRSRQLLHDLIEVCVDGEQGFERCAVRVGRLPLRELLEGLSLECRLAALQECERGEHYALHRYEEAMRTELPEPVRDVVASQYAGVRRNHDRVRAWRDGARAAQAGTSG